MVFSLCAENFRHTERASRTVKDIFRENQIAGYELEYPDGHAVCVFYNPWEKEALQKLPEGNWKLLCDGKRCAEDGAEMKESMMLPAKSMVLLARE